MVKKYRTAPVVIKAVQFDGSNVAEIESFVNDGSLEVTTFYCCETPCAYSLDIHTLEGKMHVSEGDYIIKGLRGEFYPCKPDVFKEKYIEL